VKTRTPYYGESRPKTPRSAQRRGAGNREDKFRGFKNGEKRSRSTHGVETGTVGEEELGAVPSRQVQEKEDFSGGTQLKMLEDFLQNVGRRSGRWWDKYANDLAHDTQDREKKKPEFSGCEKVSGKGKLC